MRKMMTRSVRTFTGAFLVIVSYPLIIFGAFLWYATERWAPQGTFTAVTQQCVTGDRAMIIEDIDALLRSDGPFPFIRQGHTEVSLSASGPGGPLFLGIASHAAAHHYLAGVAHARIDHIRMAQGPWPVDSTAVAGSAAPAGPPFGQKFWISTSTGLIRDGHVEDSLSWMPSSVRGQSLALVVMNADASAHVDVRLTMTVKPRWLSPIMWISLFIGGAATSLGVICLLWPVSTKESFYILDEPRLASLIAAIREEKPAPNPLSDSDLIPHTPRQGIPTRNRLGEPPTWSALLASTRPPATPRLLWPPKRADQSMNPSPQEAITPACAAETGPSDNIDDAEMIV